MYMSCIVFLSNESFCATLTYILIWNIWNNCASACLITFFNCSMVCPLTCFSIVVECFCPRRDLRTLPIFRNVFALTRQWLIDYIIVPFMRNLHWNMEKKLYAGPRHCISLSPFLNLFCSENISRQHKKQMWTATHRMCTNCGRQYHIPCNKNRNSGGSVGAIVPQASVHLAYMRLHRSDNMHHTQPFLYVICIFSGKGPRGHSSQRRIHLATEALDLFARYHWIGHWTEK